MNALSLTKDSMRKLKNEVIMPNLLALVLSGSFLQLRRNIQRIFGGRPTLNAFVSADDVESYILLQCSKKLMEKYRINTEIVLINSGVNGWASSFDVKCQWAQRDAGLFAVLHGLKEPTVAMLSKHSIKTLSSEIYNLVKTRDTAENSDIISQCITQMSIKWCPENRIQNHDAIIDDETMDSTMLAVMTRNTKRLKQLGYYNPGAIHFQGEWYPPNRLHHLERRLQCDFNMGRGTSTIDSDMYLFNKEIEIESNIRAHSNRVISNSSFPERRKETVQLFYSFRSPYSQLILPRLRKICEAFNTSVEVRPVLPMVTRGLKVPLEKEIYIAFDVARESKLWNIPFGKIVDPLHPDRIPFLRALDAFGVALKHGKEYDFLESYGVCQWGMGISAGTDSGLKHILDRAGLAHLWEELDAVIRSETLEEKFLKWEKYTASNKEHILSQGLWGVPCIRYKDVIVFGQDKLWVIKMMLEQEIPFNNDRDEENLLDEHATITASSLSRSGQKAETFNTTTANDERNSLLESIKRYCKAII